MLVLQFDRAKENRNFASFLFSNHCSKHMLSFVKVVGGWFIYNFHIWRFLTCIQNFRVWALGNRVDGIETAPYASVPRSGPPARCTDRRTVSRAAALGLGCLGSEAAMWARRGPLATPLPLARSFPNAPGDTPSCVAHRPLHCQPRARRRAASPRPPSWSGPRALVPLGWSNEPPAHPPRSIKGRPLSFSRVDAALPHSPLAPSRSSLPSLQSRLPKHLPCNVLSRPHRHLAEAGAPAAAIRHRRLHGKLPLPLAPSAIEPF
jgi:hypothetical protein